MSARTELDVAAEALRSSGFKSPATTAIVALTNGLDPRIASLPAGTVTVALDLAVAMTGDLNNTDGDVVWVDVNKVFAWESSLTDEQREALARLAKEGTPDE